MSSNAPVEPSPSEIPAAPSPIGKPRGSRVVIAGLLALLLVWFVVTQIIAHTGLPIQWIENDLPRAEQEARATGRRIFLLLQEPNCPITEDNIRNLFSQRGVRFRLAKMVCCRVQLKPDDPLRRRFDFKKEPIMLMLEPGRDTPLSPPLQGKVDFLKFKTYIDPGQGRKED